MDFARFRWISLDSNMDFVLSSMFTVIPLINLHFTVAFPPTLDFIGFNPHLLVDNMVPPQDFTITLQSSRSPLLALKVALLGVVIIYTSIGYATY